jgi:hypothetical protein
MPPFQLIILLLSLPRLGWLVYNAGPRGGDIAVVSGPTRAPAPDAPRGLRRDICHGARERAPGAAGHAQAGSPAGHWPRHVRQRAPPTPVRPTPCPHGGGGRAPAPRRAGHGGGERPLLGDPNGPVKLRGPAPPRVRVATWNVRSAKKADKRGLICAALTDMEIDIAVLQETHLEAADTWRFPSGWAYTRLDGPEGRAQGRGLAILAREDRTIRRGLQLSVTPGRAEPELDIHGVVLGSVLVLNVYVHCNPPPTERTWEALERAVPELQPQEPGPIILMGDFNPPASVYLTERAVAEFYTTLGERLGLVPLIRGVATRGDRLLDQIFVSPDLAVGAESFPPYELESRFDHALVYAAIPFGALGTARSTIGAPPRWRKLADSHDALFREAFRSLPDAEQLTAPDAPNAWELNTFFLETARQILGVHTGRSATRQAYWSDPELRRAWREIQSYMTDATPAAKASEAGRATKRALNNRLDREQSRAIQEAHEACLYKIRTGELDAEFRLLGRQKRPIAVADTLAAPYMQQVYSRAAAAAPPPATPYVDRISWTISVAEVSGLSRKWRRRRPAPTGWTCASSRSTLRSSPPC